MVISSDLPTEAPPAKLMLTFNARDATLAIAKANRWLAHDQPQQALEEYTKVLTHLAPGHPSAFLNRCLCYLVLGYPNLAAIDAYRAFLATEAAIKCPEMSGRDLLWNLYQYTKEASSKLDPWKVKPRCYVGTKMLSFLDCDLACIPISPRERMSGQATAQTLEQKIVRNLLADIRIKAMYRIALSLWKCGAGAMKSAIDWCVSAERLSWISAQDLEQFEDLNQQILLDIEREFDEENEVKEHLERHGRHFEALKYSHDAGLRGLMRTKFTTVKCELFPWDKYTLSALKDTDDAMLELNKELAASTKSPCRIQLKLEEYPSTVLSLVADGNLEPSSELFTDVSHVHAVFPHSLRHCDNCGSGLNLPHGGPQSALETAKALAAGLTKQAVDRSLQSILPGASPIKAPSSGNFEVTEDVNDETPVTPPDDEDDMNAEIKVLDDDDDDGDGIYDDFSDHMSDTTARPPNIPFDPIHDRSEGFQLCPFCQDTAFCSKACSEKGVYTSHRHLCKINRRETLYDLPSPNSWNLPSSTSTNLLNQLMQVFLANLASGQQHESRHDLERIWMRLLSVYLEAPRRLMGSSEWIALWDEDKGVSIKDLYPSRLSLQGLDDKGVGVTTDSKLVKRVPWSFDTNVLLPIESLLEIGSKKDLATGYRTALDCRRFDGWVLETLRFKVNSAMRVSRFPRSVKEYNRDLLFENRYDYGQEIVDEGIGVPDAQGRNMWMASVHPRITPIWKAKVEDGEERNVQISYREGQVSVSTKKAVRKGEDFLY